MQFKTVMMVILLLGFSLSEVRSQSSSKLGGNREEVVESLKQTNGTPIVAEAATLTIESIRSSFTQEELATFGAVIRVKDFLSIRTPYTTGTWTYKYPVGKETIAGAFFRPYKSYKPGPDKLAIFVLQGKADGRLQTVKETNAMLSGIESAPGITNFKLETFPTKLPVPDWIFSKFSVVTPQGKKKFSYSCIYFGNRQFEMTVTSDNEQRALTLMKSVGTFKEIETLTGVDAEPIVWRYKSGEVKGTLNANDGDDISIKPEGAPIMWIPLQLQSPKTQKYVQEILVKNGRETKSSTSDN